MTWIHGYYGLRHDALESRRAQSAAADATLVWRADGFFVAASGAYPTLVSGGTAHSDEVSGGWIVAGLGLHASNGALHLVDEQGWGERLASQPVRVSDLDGHFCGVRLQNGGLELFNDALGLRTIFISRRGRGTLFSTRLDWLLQTIEHPMFDFEALGAQWLGRAELGVSSAFSGVQRLGQGGSVTITGDGVHVRSRPFDLEDASSRSVRETLVAVANPSVPEIEARSLACSGGLDSRVQLAAMLQNREGLRLHSYGAADHPDNQVSALLASLLDLPLERMEPKGWPPDLSAVQNVATAVHAYAASSTAVDWMHYDVERRAHAILIDGSLGEAGRCFFYRAMRRGRGADLLISGEPAALARIQRQPRPAVFTPSIRSVMERGHVAAVEEALSGLPATSGADDRADLLMLRLEGPRYAGYAASHVDDLAVGYFPFAQPSLLRALLAVPPDDRRNGKLYRRLISELAPELTHVPLVRNGKYVATHPFGLTGKPAALWARAARLLGRAWQDTRTKRFLRALEEPIRDLVRSDPTRTFEAYDRQAISRLVDGYFEGRHADAVGVDRWLAFELWRLGVTGTWI